MNSQDELTRRHYTRERPYVAFLCNKQKQTAAGYDTYVAETFKTCDQAEAWWNAQTGFARVWTVKKGETIIVFAK